MNKPYKLIKNLTMFSLKNRLNNKLSFQRFIILINKNIIKINVKIFILMKIVMIEIKFQKNNHKNVLKFKNMKHLGKKKLFKII